MKKSKYINLFSASALLLSSLTMPITSFAAENDVESNEKAGLKLAQGDFILEVSNITSFGSHELKSYVQVVSAGFDAPFTVIDARGTQEGWDLTVSATTFSIVEPKGGWIQENKHNLPLGSLSLNTLNNIKGVYGEKQAITPIKDDLGVAIDLGQEVRVAHAAKGKGMGMYALTHAGEALNLVLDPATAKIDRVNYPSGQTPYEATIYWNLVAGPGVIDGSPGNPSDGTGGGDENPGIPGVPGTDPTDPTNPVEPNEPTEPAEEAPVQKVKSFSFEQTRTQENVYTLTVDDLKSIINIKSNNGGLVEILSINGNEVTVKVTGGQAVGQVLISGEYVAAQTKFVTNQNAASYTDADGYKGTLTSYVASGAEGDTIWYDVEADGGTSYMPQSYVGYSMPFNAEGYSGTLYFISEEIIEHDSSQLLDVYYTTFANDINNDTLHTLKDDEIIASLTGEHPYLKNVKIIDKAWDSNIETGTFNSGGMDYPYKRESTVRISVNGFQTLVTLGGYISKPDTRVYKYQGNVTKPASDTRKYENLYQYDVEVNYFENKK